MTVLGDNRSLSSPASDRVMRKMPVISSDAELNDRITRICEKFDNYFLPVFFTSAEDALEYLKYELPEINVINFSDPAINTVDIIDTIKADPWLHYGGIVGVHARKDEKTVAEKLPNSNVISLIPRGEFVTSFFRLLRILIQNRQILFQRDIQTYLIHNISGSFVMDNDPFNIRTYSNLVSNYLYNSNYIDAETKDALHVALFEMLMNAVEHGNCDITYDEKTQWLDEHGDILDLIRKKNQDPEIRAKRVFFSYRITQQKSFFSIRDQGEGFDWRSRVSEQGANLEAHGHGIRMTSHYMSNLQYNEAGNQVSFELEHRQNATNIVPGIFQNREEVRFSDREEVFQEGEESNYLYYIASGSFSIYAGGRFITNLSTDDIFLGEMSFLLNNRRSATVVSKGRSVLIKISKNDFVRVIKEKPHYGVFLARLLAQRLLRLNSRVANMKG
jgi:anti-sigma regulatory factor (Ser/Thr protein kinase)